MEYEAILLSLLNLQQKFKINVRFKNVITELKDTNTDILNLLSEYMKKFIHPPNIDIAKQKLNEAIIDSSVM